MIYMAHPKRPRWRWWLLRIWHWPRPVPATRIMMNNIVVSGGQGIWFEKGQVHISSNTIVRGTRFDNR